MAEELVGEAGYACPAEEGREVSRGERWPQHPHAPVGRVDDFGQHLGHVQVERGYPVWLVADQDAARAVARIGLGRGLSGHRRWACACAGPKWRSAAVIAPEAQIATDSAGPSGAVAPVIAKRRRWLVF